jgi:hypothetical protein
MEPRPGFFGESGQDLYQLSISRFLMRYNNFLIAGGSIKKFRATKGASSPPYRTSRTSEHETPLLKKSSLPGWI